MTKQEAIDVLIEYQTWRRAEGKYDEAGAKLPYTPSEIGQAIDIALNELRNANTK